MTGETDSETCAGKPKAGAASAMPAKDAQEKTATTPEGTQTPEGLQNAQSELADANKDLEETLKRAYADFDNFRKRCEAQREEEQARAEEKLVIDLLQVVDEFDAAIDSLEEGEHKKGVVMVRNNFWKILSLRGLAAIECVGKKFDSSVHDAAKSVEAKSDSEDGVIVSELRRGYEYNGKILRHPLVVVAKK